MATHLHIEGPFEVCCESNGRAKRIDSNVGKEFWKEGSLRHLKSKQGCYVFATRAGKGFRPWYVGKASKGFEQETFTHHKLVHYNSVLFQGKKGTPVLFFVAPDGLKKKVPVSELTHMEKELIQFALIKNPELCNTHQTKNIPRWSIQGVVRAKQGKPTSAAKCFRLMMGI